jgi:hypothetical protein
MKKEIDINKLSEILRSLDGDDIGSLFCYNSEYPVNLGFDKKYLINKFKEEKNLTVEEVVEDIVNASKKIILEEYYENKKLRNELEKLKELKEYLNKKGLDSDFNDYIKEKELLEKEEFEKLEIPF